MPSSFTSYPAYLTVPVAQHASMPPWWMASSPSAPETGGVRGQQARRPPHLDPVTLAQADSLSARCIAVLCSRLAMSLTFFILLVVSGHRRTNDAPAGDHLLRNFGEIQKVIYILRISHSLIIIKIFELCPISPHRALDGLTTWAIPRAKTSSAGTAGCVSNSSTMFSPQDSLNIITGPLYLGLDVFEDIFQRICTSSIIHSRPVPWREDEVRSENSWIHAFTCAIPVADHVDPADLGRTVGLHSIIRMPLIAVADIDMTMRPEESGQLDMRRNSQAKQCKYSSTCSFSPYSHCRKRPTSIPL